MEAATRHEEVIKPKLVVQPQQVWGAFETFEGGVQKGYSSQESRLSSYAQFMQTVRVFFTQPQLRVTPSVDAQELVKKLFYQHETTATSPIEFFAEAKKRLTKDILNDGRIEPGTARWRDELALIQALSEREVIGVESSLSAEKKDKEKLIETARSTSEFNDIEVIEGIRSFDDRKKEVQNRAIKELAKDPELTQDIARRDRFVNDLESLTQDLNPDTLEEKLSPYEDFLKKPDGSSLIPDLSLRVFYNRNDPKVKEILQEVSRSAQSPDFLWKQWTLQGHIPADLLNSFDELMALGELQEVAHVVRSAPLDVRARNLLPFLEKGISATMLVDIVEGRYEFPDELIANQVDAFIHFYDSYETKGKGNFKKKIIAIALASTIAASPFIYNHFTNPETPPPNDIDQIMQELSKEELTKVRRFVPGTDLGEGGEMLEDSETMEVDWVEVTRSEGKGNRPSQNSGRGTGNSSGGVQEGNSQEGSSPSGSESSSPSQESVSRERSTNSTSERKDSISPHNDSAEELKKEQKRIEWELSGRDLWGYYRTNTASFFDSKTKSWIVSRQASTGLKTKVATRKDIVVTQSITIQGKQPVELPLRGDYAVTQEGIQVSSNISNIGLGRLANGSYQLYFSSDGDVGKTVTISYALGKSEKSTIPAPSAQELEQMKMQMLSVSSLPGEVKEFMLQLKVRKDLTAGAKAKVLEKYIKTTFQYSLSPQCDLYYHEAQNGFEFIRRIFELKRADCDVTNTAFTAGLRYLSIPSRLAYGYLHTGSVNPKDTVLTAAEKHGWVEAYIDGEWVSLDATPTKMDDYTQKELEGKLSPSQIADLDAREELAIFIQSVKDWPKAHPGLATLLEYELLNLAVLAPGLLFRRKNNQLADRLQDELQQRAQKYLGVDNPNIQKRLTEEEMDKIDKNTLRRRWFLSLVVPGFTVGSLANDVVARVRLSKIPYAQREERVLQSFQEPNEVEFLTKVLGYPEGEISRRMERRAFIEASRQLRRVFEETAGRSFFFSDAEEEYRDFAYGFMSTLRQEFTGLSEPPTEAALSALKEQTNKRLYVEYSTKYEQARQKYERRSKKEKEKEIKKGRVRPTESLPLPVMYPEDVFNEQMEGLYLNRMVRWKLNRVRRRASIRSDIVGTGGY